MEKLEKLESDYEALQGKEKEIIRKMNKAIEDKKWNLEYRYECLYFKISNELNKKYMEIQDAKRDLGMKTLHKNYLVQ